MYVLYTIIFTTFLMTLFSAVYEPKEKRSFRPDVVAMQMASWHVAAQKKCSHVGCVGGSVDPAEYISKIVKDSAYVKNGYFQSTYDNSSGYIVTSLTGVGMGSGELNYSTISTSFHGLLGGGTSSSVGYWDRSKNRVFLPSKHYGTGYLDVTQNSNVGLSPNLFVRVPDKSPVLINRVQYN